MMRRLIAFVSPYWLTIRVVGTFIGLIAIFFTMLTYTPVVERIDLASILAQAIAWMSGLFLRGLSLIVGFPLQIRGTNLASGNFSVDVSPACSGAVPTM